MSEQLTAEQIADLAAKSAIEAIKTLQKPERKFIPGGDDGNPTISVTKDEGDKPFKSIGEHLIAVKNAYQNGAIDKRLYRMAVNDQGVSLKATGLSEGVPADGGFLIEPQFIPQILERTYQYGVLASRCTRIPVGAGYNGVKMPAVSETSLASSRFGGIVSYWAAEAGTKTASMPQFRQVSLELKKLIGLCYATDELLQDAVALEAWLMKAFPMEFGFKLDDAIINGSGAGQPLGIMNSPCLVTVAKESGQAAATIQAENIIKMHARLWGGSSNNAVWLINQDIEPQLHTMSLAVGTGGVPVYMPAGGLSENAYGTLYGKPVLPVWQCQTLGTVGDIIFADLSQYLLAEQGGINAASSIHVKFVYDETAFRFVMRIDGQPWWNSALTPYKGSNTQSPFVVLATRS